jgi:hypothetical protein
VEESVFESFSFLEAWAVAPRSREPGPVRLEMPAGVPGSLAVPDALGAGLWMSSSDAAIVVYRAASGWRYVELGY